MISETHLLHNTTTIIQLFFPKHTVLAMTFLITYSSTSPPSSPFNSRFGNIWNNPQVTHSTASLRIPKDHGKTKNTFCHSFFSLFSVILKTMLPKIAHAYPEFNV